MKLFSSFLKNFLIWIPCFLQSQKNEYRNEYHMCLLNSSGGGGRYKSSCELGLVAYKGGGGGENSSKSPEKIQLIQHFNFTTHDYQLIV